MVWEDTVTIRGVTMSLKSYLIQQERIQLQKKIRRDCDEFNKDAFRFSFVKRRNGRSKHKNVIISEYQKLNNVVLSTKIYDREEIKREQKEEDRKMERMTKYVMLLMVKSKGRWTTLQEYERQLLPEHRRNSLSSVVTRLYNYFDSVNLIRRKRIGRSYLYCFDSDNVLSIQNESDFEKFVDSCYPEFLRWENNKRRARKVDSKENDNVNNKEEIDRDSSLLSNTTIPSEINVNVTVKVLFSFSNE